MAPRSPTPPVRLPPSPPSSACAVSRRACLPRWGASESIAQPRPVEEIAMLCLFSARRLKPGAFDQFRRAWEPPSDEFPPGFQRAYHARNVRDEDEIVSFGLFDGSLEELGAGRAEHEQQERRRKAAMAAFGETPHVGGI